MQFSTCSYSQTKGRVKFEFSYNIPARLGKSYFDNRPPYKADNHNEIFSALHDTGSYEIDNPLIGIHDTINFDILRQNVPWLTDKYSVHIVIDTANQVLHEFSISYQYRYMTTETLNQTNSSIVFQGLPYTEYSDSSIALNERGAACRSHFVSVSFLEDDHEGYGMGFYTDTRIGFDSLLEDTSQYYCTARITPIPAVSAVKVDHDNSSIIIATSLNDHKIIVHFPPQNQAQTLQINDIVGRTIDRILIPVGESSFVLSGLNFRAGIYFARIGREIKSFRIL